MSEQVSSSAPSAPSGNAQSLGRILGDVSCTIDDLVKKVALAVGNNDRVYIDEKGIGAQQQVSRVLYELLGAKQAIQAYRDLAGE